MTDHVRNLFEVLGVSVDATPDEIKKAYRRLVRMHHPDTGDADLKQYEKVTHAYEVLRDPVMRSKHIADLTAEARERSMQARRSDQFDDLIGDAFGGPPKPTPNPRSQPRPRPMPPRQAPRPTSGTRQTSRPQSGGGSGQRPPMFGPSSVPPTTPKSAVPTQPSTATRSSMSPPATHRATISEFFESAAKWLGCCLVATFWSGIASIWVASWIDTAIHGNHPGYPWNTWLWMTLILGLIIGTIIYYYEEGKN